MKRLILSKNFVFNKFIRPSGSYTDNRHGAAINYLAYMIKGSVRLVSADRTVEVREGEAFFIPKGLGYESFWYGDSSVEFYSFGFHSLHVEEVDGYALQRIEVSKEQVDMLHKIYSPGGVSLSGISDFYSVMAEIIPTMERARQRAEENVARKIAEYIRENPMASMPEVARACLVSESYLYLAFRSAMDMTPNEYRQRRLCEYGVELLESTDRSLEEIAETLGFSSGSYFRKVLKRHLSVTPREIRKRSAL